jgi:hypothetical protein
MNPLRLVPQPRRPLPGAPVASRFSEKAVMKTAVLKAARRGDNLSFHLAYGATFPLFLAAELLQRWKARASGEGSLPAMAKRSVFAAAREGTLIAISYALMARTTLRRSARQNRAERLS